MPLISRATYSMSINPDKTGIGISVKDTRDGAHSQRVVSTQGDYKVASLGCSTDLVGDFLSDSRHETRLLETLNIFIRGWAQAINSVVGLKSSLPSHFLNALSVSLSCRRYRTEARHTQPSLSDLIKFILPWVVQEYHALQAAYHQVRHLHDPNGERKKGKSVIDGGLRTKMIRIAIRYLTTIERKSQDSSTTVLQKLVTRNSTDNLSWGHLIREKEMKEKQKEVQRALFFFSYFILYLSIWAGPVKLLNMEGGLCCVRNYCYTWRHQLIFLSTSAVENE